MIKTTDDHVPIINGLIMIDCWVAPPFNPELNRFYQILLTELFKFDFKCIINAAYNIKLDCNDPSIKNTLKHYAWNEGLTANPELIQNIIKSSRSETITSPYFTSTILDNNYSFLLLETNDFLHHWKTVLAQKVNHWLVVGGAWNRCLHRRNMGLINLANLSKITDPLLNFYCIENGCYLDDGRTTDRSYFENDAVEWAEINDFGYKLLPMDYNNA